MPATTSSPTRIPTDHPTAVGASLLSAGGTFSRPMLLRALASGLVVVALLAAAVGAVLFTLEGPGGGPALPTSARVYYVAGVVAALGAAMLTVWLHGRFAATTADQGRAPRTRLQTLLAAAFAVKLAVLALGVFGLRQIPLTDEPAKFVDVATFAVTFAGAALVCQLATAAVLARTLSRRRGPAPSAG